MVIIRYYVYIRVFNWQMYLEIIEFGDSPIFCSLFIILKLTICLMYVDTSRPKLGIP
jgi:hypothetical protein